MSYIETYLSHKTGPTLAYVSNTHIRIVNGATGVLISHLWHVDHLKTPFTTCSTIRLTVILDTRFFQISYCLLWHNKRVNMTRKCNRATRETDLHRLVFRETFQQTNGLHRQTCTIKYNLILSLSIHMDLISKVSGQVWYNLSWWATETCRDLERGARLQKYFF